MTCRECAKFKKCSGKIQATKYYDAVMAVGNVEQKCPNFKHGSTAAHELLNHILKRIKIEIDYNVSFSKQRYPHLTVFVSRPLWDFMKLFDDTRYGISAIPHKYCIGKIFGYTMRVYDGLGEKFYVCQDDGVRINLDARDGEANVKGNESQKSSITDGDKTYEFPVSVGDIVKCKVEDENHVVEFIPYKVLGLAVYNSKKYVISPDGNFNEIGSEDCILP